jgi:hypothetical protein
MQSPLSPSSASYNLSPSISSRPSTSTSSTGINPSSNNSNSNSNSNNQGSAVEQKLEGKWEHPALSQIDKMKRAQTFTEADMSTVIWNGTALIFAIGLWAGGYNEYVSL